MNDGLDWVDWNLWKQYWCSWSGLSRSRKFWEAVSGLGWFKMRWSMHGDSKVMGDGHENICT